MFLSWQMRMLVFEAMASFSWVGLPKGVCCSTSCEAAFEESQYGMHVIVLRHITIMHKLLLSPPPTSPSVLVNSIPCYTSLGPFHLETQQEVHGCWYLVVCLSEHCEANHTQPRV